MNQNNILDQNPLSWKGHSFRNKATGNVFKVRKVIKRTTRYRILLESDLAIYSHYGFDSVKFKNNFVHVQKSERKSSRRTRKSALFKK